MPAVLHSAKRRLKSAPFLLLPLLMSCEDTLENLYPKVAPVQLPAATQTGANAFGFSLNGQVWEANNTPTLTGKVLTPNVRYHRGQLWLDAFRRLQAAEPVTNVHLTADQVTAPGVYALGAVQPGRTSYARLQTSNAQVEYFTDAQRPGTLTITRLDTTGAHPVIAGRFEFRAIPREGTHLPAGFPAELRVTEGRFDIQLNR